MMQEKGVDENAPISAANSHSKMASNCNKTPTQAEAKPSRRGGGGGRFASLLSDVTNSIKLEQDEKVAVKMQDEDASSLMNEWLQEVKDKQLAAKISESLEAEAKDRTLREQHEGETAAMKLAVEERRRVQLEAQSKKELEEKDCYLAKHVYDQEKHVLDLCERDDALAREMYDAEVAEQLQKAEELRAKMERKRAAELATADEMVSHLVTLSPCHHICPEKHWSLSLTHTISCISRHPLSSPKRRKQNWSKKTACSLRNKKKKTWQWPDA